MSTYKYILYVSYSSVHKCLPVSLLHTLTLTFENLLHFLLTAAAAVNSALVAPEFHSLLAACAGDLHFLLSICKTVIKYTQTMKLRMYH